MGVAFGIGGISGVFYAGAGIAISFAGAVGDRNPGHF